MASDDTKMEVTVRKKVGGTSILHMVVQFSKQITAVAAIYLLGYFNISPAWLIGPVILTVLRDEWKKENELKRNVAKAAALCDEKDVILARVEDLPAWVFFPDVERAEWLNRILRQVWPNVNHYAKDLIKDTIEPAIRTSLVEYKLSGFRFEKMRLGTIPPRIGGIKVYDRNVSRNEIIMDMDIFYAGDCDISFVLSGISGGIKDFQIHGMVRVVMKPLITTMPLVGGLQIFFLNNPSIDFNLVGVADLLDMPGLSDMLRRIIVEQVAAMMVLPNKLPIKLSNAVPAHTLKFPEPEGVLRVHVVEAKQLMKKDIGVLGKGKSDPYAIVTVGAQQFKTKTIDNTVEPKWDFWCEFAIFTQLGQEVNIQLMDLDHSKKDSKLGWATVKVHGIAKKGEVDTWLSLEEVKTGLLHLRMTWLQLSSDIADLKAALAETQMLRVSGMSSAVLIVFIDSAKNLPSIGGRTPDSQLQLSVGKTTQMSTIQYRTDCPVFEQGFTFLVNNPETDSLHLKFSDQKTGSELGRFTYNVSVLLDSKSLELQDQPFALQRAGPDSKVFLSMRLRILKPGVGSDGEKGVGEAVKDNSVPETHPATAPAPLSRASSLKQPDSPTKPALSKSSETEALLSPVEDVMVVSSAPPYKVESVPPGAVSADKPALHHRTPSTTASAGESGLGRIQLTLRYSVQRQRLIVAVHKIANLPLKDPSNIPDPYVKLYLLPERSKDSKRKTETVKDNCNPTYEETFEYVMSQGELSTRSLEVTVLTQKTWKSPVMGQVIVDLSHHDLAQGSTSWFDLQPGSSEV